MKVITFYIQNADKVLMDKGYYVGKNGTMMSGYTREAEKGRYHAYLTGKDSNTIKLHFDSLIKGFHKVLSNHGRLQKEKIRIIK